MLTDNQKTEFFNGFVKALLWSTGEELDDYELAPIAAQRLREYCDAWCDVNAELLKAATCLGRSYAGHGRDLAFTANGHGVGFWDRGLGELGESLTVAAKLDYREEPFDYDVRKVRSSLAPNGYFWYWCDLRIRDPFTGEPKDSGTSFASEYAAIINAYSDDETTPPECLGSMFDAYISDEGLVYVEGFTQ